MNSRIWAFVAAALVTVVPTPGQNSSGAAGHPVKTNAWTMPRTPDGHPDLQENWTNATLTLLQRPPEFAEKLVLTKAEADVYEKQRLEAMNKDRRDGRPSPTSPAALMTLFMRAEQGWRPLTGSFELH